MATLTVIIEDNQQLGLHCVQEIILTPIQESMDPTDPDWTRTVVIKTKHGTFELELHSDEHRDYLNARLQSGEKL